MTTTPGETPAERRLREIETLYSSVPGMRPTRGEQDACADALEAGREALALLREWSRGDYGFPEEDCRRFTEDARALLARCAEDAR